MVTKSWASTTSAFDRSIRWPVDHVCSQSRCSHIPTLKGQSLFRQSMFQGLLRLTNVHLGVIRAGDLIHHPCPLVPWYRVLG